jgi:hypothetical protein
VGSFTKAALQKGKFPTTRLDISVIHWTKPEPVVILITETKQAATCIGILKHPHSFSISTQKILNLDPFMQM